MRIFLTFIIFAALLSFLPNHHLEGAFDKSMNTGKCVTILLGPPGSGKGTQAEKITKDLKVPHISTGDLFRVNIKEGTPLGKTAKSYIDAGQLVPDSLVLDMLFDRVSQPDCKNGYLLDGFPRTIPQAEAFQQRLDSNTKLTVINLHVDDQSVIKRISGRLICKDCGAIYNKYYTPPKKEEICNQCSGELYHRPDDSEEVVKERLQVYKEQTKPLVHFYNKQGLLHNVDGQIGVDKTNTAIMDILNSRGCK